MASDDPSGARPAPVVLRIKLRYDDVDAMVQRFAPNVGKSGLFLPTKSLQAIGAEIKFELRLADDTPVLVGLGRVKAAKPPDPANPKAAFGMAIELMRVTRESREVILKMLERRKALGLPEVAIPYPADIDASRRAELDTATKDTASAAVPVVALSIDSAPVLATPISSDSGKVMTAPRRNSGPLAVAKVHGVAALEPEPPRKKRAPVSELIERASGQVSAVSVVHVPGLDDDIDVGAVLARARALAGGNLDAELDALREMSAAPIEIGIEAASAELAKQLGGGAVRRDRSAKWAPPPSSISTPIAEAEREPVVEEKAEPEPEPEPEVMELRDSTPMLDVDPDPEDDEEPEPPHEEVDADQIADEIHQLGEGDVEEVEHTQIGQLSDPPGFEHVFRTEPGVTADLERSLERQLADAEEEDDLGMASPPPEAAAAPHDDGEEQEIDDFEILAEADAEDADLLAAHGEQDASGVGITTAEPEPVAEPEPAAEPEPEPASTPAPADPDDSVGSNAHIPARIRARQRRVSGQHVIVRSTPLVHPEPESESYTSESEPYEPEPDPEYVPPRARYASEPAPERPSMLDFAARLDLSDEFEAVPDAAESPPELDEALGELDPRQISAGYALAAFDEDRDEPSQLDDDYEAESGFTIAGRLSVDSIDFDAPPIEQPAGFPPLRAFDSSDVSTPFTRQEPPPSAKRQPAAAESYDLESALEDLDVDLDDLSVSVAVVPQPTSLRGPRAERVVPKRADTDIPIDFDDDHD